MMLPVFENIYYFCGHEIENTTALILSKKISVTNKGMGTFPEPNEALCSLDLQRAFRFCMKEIKLTQGKVAMVDDADFDWLNQWKWYAHKNKKENTYYARRNVREGDKQIAIQMHRQILELTESKVKGDHRDHDGLNNQRYNLRPATQLQNNQNKTPVRNSSSKYLGVTLNKRILKGKEYVYWAATIKVSKKRKHIGCFKIEEDAARAYDEAAKKYFGEFANPNFK